VNDCFKKIREFSGSVGWCACQAASISSAWEAPWRTNSFKRKDFLSTRIIDTQTTAFVIGCVWFTTLEESFLSTEMELQESKVVNNLKINKPALDETSHQNPAA